ncbi:5727_t:CDS:1, partial [Dentiscutata heterogama]
SLELLLSDILQNNHQFWCCIVLEHIVSKAFPSRLFRWRVYNLLVSYSSWTFGTVISLEFVP